MGERFQLPMPMWTVQFHLLGGFRRIGGIVLIYSMVAMVGVYALRRLMPRSPWSAVVDYLIIALAVIQLIVVFAGGCNAVHRSTLRDFQTRMIESHRLTPMSNLTVAAGYLFGSTLVIEVLFVINVVIGTALLASIASPLGPWLYGNAFILTGGLMLWAMMVFAGVGPTKPMNPGAILLGVSMLGIPLGMVLPGAAMFLGAYSVILGFWSLTGQGPVTSLSLVIVGAVSLVLTCFWLFAAAAKYRRPDLPAFNAVRGLLFLVMWLVFASVGVAAFQYIAQTKWRSDELDDALRAQWICTLLASLIVGTMAVSGAVQCRLLVARGTAPRNWTDRVPDGFVAIAAALLICIIPAAVGVTGWSDLIEVHSESTSGAWATLAVPWAYTLIAGVLAMLSVRAVLTIAHCVSQSAAAITGVFILFAWAGPALVDFIHAQVVQTDYGPLPFSWLMTCSPAGMIVVSWVPVSVAQWPGILVQAGLLVVLGSVAKRVSNRHRSARVPIR